MIFPAEHDRRAWLSVKLGWLTAYTLDAPVLVFPEVPESRAAVDAPFNLELARERYFAIRGRVARDRSEIPNYKKAMDQLYVAQKTLVELAIGYTWPNQWDVETFGRPVRVLWAFDL